MQIGTAIDRKWAEHAEAASGMERDEALDGFLQTLWDYGVDGDVDRSDFVEIGNEVHDKPAPFSDDLSSAMALAVRLLGNSPVDIEVAHRVVGHSHYARAQIVGPLDDAYGKASTPALALIAATLRAHAERLDAAA